MKTCTFTKFFTYFIQNSVTLKQNVHTCDSIDFSGILMNAGKVIIKEYRIRDKRKIVQRIEATRVECVEKSKSKVRAHVTDLIILTPYPLTPALSTCSSSYFTLLTEQNTRFSRKKQLNLH